MAIRQTALVTGASRGIGAAIAKALVAHDIRVALVSRSRDALQTLAQSLGPDTVAHPCDVTDAAAVQRMTNAVSKDFEGPPDLIINNAGIFRLASLESMPAQLFLDTMNSNVVAPFLVMRAFLPSMRERQRGHIITIGSIADRTVMVENGAYAPSKYALRAMHEVLRLELRGSGIRTSLISPAATDTTLWDAVLAEPHERQMPPRSAMLDASAVADAVIYAISQPASVNIDELRLSRS